MGRNRGYTAVMEVFRVPGDSYEENLYYILLDFYWYKTHPDRENDGGWHGQDDEQCLEFTKRVMEFIRNELKRYDE